MKKLIVFCALLLLSPDAYSQLLNPFVRFNVATGASYSESYSNGSMSYNPGGGAGVEFGNDFRILKYLYPTISVGYQQLFALNVQAGIAGSSSNTYSFNRTFVNVGIAIKSELETNTFKHFIVHLGTGFNYPGTFKHELNSRNLGDIEYDPSQSLFFEFAVEMEIFNNVSVEPNIRFRVLQFDATSYTRGSVLELSEDLRKLDSNGIEFGVRVFPF